MVVPASEGEASLRERTTTGEIGETSAELVILSVQKTDAVEETRLDLHREIGIGDRAGSWRLSAAEGVAVFVVYDESASAPSGEDEPGSQYC